MADIIKPDLCILGAGAAGIALAMGARRHGASVVLIDLGTAGDSLKSGPIAAAALAAAASHAQALRRASGFGVGNGDPKVNFRAMHDHVQSAIGTIARTETPERLRALGIETIAGPAAFTDKRTLQAGDSMIRARRFVLASGSSPIVPPIKNLGEVPFFTTDTIFANAYKLSHLVVLGGGAAGLECAQAYRRLGCDVTVLETGAALAEADPELAAIALRQLREEGVVIHERTQTFEIVPRSQGIGVMMRHENGQEATLNASHILLALGRRPNVDALGLDKAAIRLDTAGDGRLALGASLKTSNRRIHAIGEAAGSVSSLQAARHDARIVLDSALFNRSSTADEGVVPHLIAIDPQLAQIGLTESQAKLRLRGNYSVFRASFAENERAIATRRRYGAVKLIADRAGAIHGASIVGPEAGELIALFALAIARSVKLPDLARLALPGPSFAGIVAQLIEAWEHQAGPDPRLARRLALIRRLP